MEESGGMAEGLHSGHAPLDQGGLDGGDGAHLFQPLVAEQKGTEGPQGVQFVGDVLKGLHAGEDFCGELEFVVCGHFSLPPNSTAP